ncbi:Hypothetical protein AA314_05244 [Archangium gephyra]|uniref:Uncharacterized protein n=1 Tax=Archangium gephyra TaxID=48 RepID=A0AAC8Q9Q7_9BACT|nr:Hypothetical protein AA314_05244 [Archangium gephyra]
MVQSARTHSPGEQVSGPLRCTERVRNPIINQARQESPLPRTAGGRSGSERA